MVVFERLSMEIARNDTLRSLRRTLGDAPQLGYQVAWFAKNGDSPTASLKIFDETAGKLRVLVNFLAKVKRDYGATVCGEVAKTFRVRGKLMPGEHAAETEGYSLVIFEPELTFDLVTVGLTWYDSHVRPAYVTKIVGFPSLEWLARDAVRRDVGLGWALGNSWQRDVEKAHLKRLRGSEAFAGARRRYLHGWQSVATADPLRDIQQRLPSKDDLFSKAPYALLVRGDGSDFRSIYKHPRWRDRIGIWSFEVPKGLVPNELMIHSAAACRHEDWRRLRPNHSSSGTSHGLGVVVIDPVNLSQEHYLDDAIVPPLVEFDGNGRRLRLTLCANSVVDQLERRIFGGA